MYCLQAKHPKSTYCNTTGRLEAVVFVVKILADTLITAESFICVNISILLQECAHLFKHTDINEPNTHAHLLGLCFERCSTQQASGASGSAAASRVRGGGTLGHATGLWLRTQTAAQV